MGKNKVGSVHLKKYSDGMKHLITDLYEEHLNTGKKQINTDMTESNLIALANKDPLLGSDSDDHKTNRSVLKGEEMSDERREKLKVRLLNESQTYY